MSFPGHAYPVLSRPELSLYEQVTGGKNFVNEHPIQGGSHSIPSSSSNHKKKQQRDPMTHRIIEKRRRDKMNNCLADLSQLIPSNYVKRAQGRNRIEKTEIIEMAIRHLKHLQAHTCASQTTSQVKKTTYEDYLKQYRLGYQESMSESIRFLVEIEGLQTNSGTCMRLVHHLQKHYDNIVQGLSFATKQATVDLQKDRNREGMHSFNNKTERCEKYCTTNNSTMKNYNKQHNNDQDYTGQLTTDRFFGQQNSDISPLENQYSTVGCNVSKYDTNPISTTVVGSTNENKTEDFYKFKKTIKERFAAGLQQPVDNVLDETRTTTPLLYKCCLPNTQQSGFVASITSCKPQQDTGKVTSGTGESYVKAEENQFDCMNVHSNLCMSQSTGGSSSGYNTDDSKYKSIFSELSPSTSYDSPPENSPIPLSNNLSSTHIPKIPIFALHPTANFYIPLAISASTIESHIHSFDDSIQSLYPVSICVNFSYPPVLTDKLTHTEQNHRAAKRAHLF